MSGHIGIWRGEDAVEIRKKNLDRREWYTDADRAFSCFYHKDEFFEGSIGLITFTGIGNPDIIDASTGKLCIADKGYQWLELAPKDKRYVLTAMFKNDEIFQIYVDITSENHVFDSGDAEFYDLFLDIVIKDDVASIIDRNELATALSEGIITESDYNNAIKESEEFVRYYSSNTNAIKEKLFEYRDLFTATDSSLWK